MCNPLILPLNPTTSTQTLIISLFFLGSYLWPRKKDDKHFCLGYKPREPINPNSSLVIPISFSPSWVLGLLVRGILLCELNSHSCLWKETTMALHACLHCWYWSNCMLVLMGEIIICKFYLVVGCTWFACIFFFIFFLAL